MDYKEVFNKYIAELNSNSAFDEWFNKELNSKAPFFIEKIKELDNNYYKSYVKGKEMSFNKLVVVALRVNYILNHPNGYNKKDFEAFINSNKQTITFKNEGKKTDRVLVNMLCLARIGYKDEYSPKDCFTKLNELFQKVKYDDLHHANFNLHAREVEDLLIWCCVYFGLGGAVYNNLLGYYFELKNLFNMVDFELCADKIENEDIKDYYNQSSFIKDIKIEEVAEAINKYLSDDFSENQSYKNCYITSDIIDEITTMMEESKVNNDSNDVVIETIKKYMLNHCSSFGIEQNSLCQLQKNGNGKIGFVEIFSPWKEMLNRIINNNIFYGNCKNKDKKTIDLFVKDFSESIFFGYGSLSDNHEQLCKNHLDFVFDDVTQSNVEILKERKKNKTYHCREKEIDIWLNDKEIAKLQSFTRMPRNAILLWVLDNYYQDLIRDDCFDIEGFNNKLIELQEENVIVSLNLVNPFDKYILSSYFELEKISKIRPTDFICKIVSEGTRSISEEISKENRKENGR